MTSGNGSESTNIGGKVPFPVVDRSLSDRMDKYDALPRELRDILKYAFLNLSLTVDDQTQSVDVSTRSAKAQIQLGQEKATLETYGPDHPDLLKTG